MRADVVFLTDGIPVLVIECKNANKDEAVALGVDQIRHCHRETPKLFVGKQLQAKGTIGSFVEGVVMSPYEGKIARDCLRFS